MFPPSKSAQSPSCFVAHKKSSTQRQNYLPTIRGTEKNRKKQSHVIVQGLSNRKEEEYKQKNTKEKDNLKRQREEGNKCRALNLQINI